MTTFSIAKDPLCDSSRQLPCFPEFPLVHNHSVPTLGRHDLDRTRTSRVLSPVCFCFSLRSKLLRLNFDMDFSGNEDVSTRRVCDQLIWPTDRGSPRASGRRGPSRPLEWTLELELTWALQVARKTRVVPCLFQRKNGRFRMNSVPLDANYPRGLSYFA